MDLPPEEVERLESALREHELDNIFLISPTTPEDRIRTIVDRASGFIYYVAVKGVTGSGQLNVTEVADRVSLIRNMTALPIAVGFGIKDADSARAVAGVADAVVVGSALIDQMVRAGSTDSSLDEIQIHQAAVKLLQSIREGVDSSRS